MLSHDQRAELQELVTGGSESEICEYISSVAWDDLEEAYSIASSAGVTENDVMRWIYFNLK